MTLADDIRRLLELDAADHLWPAGWQETLREAARIVERDREDAERYRWLRGETGRTGAETRNDSRSDRISDERLAELIACYSHYTSEQDQEDEQARLLLAALRELAQARQAAARQGGQAVARPELVNEIAAAINRNSAENGSDTPDFILAEFLAGCLGAFDAATRERTRWYAAPPVAAGWISVEDEVAQHR